MKVLVTLFLLSLTGVICFGMIAVLFIAIDTIFESNFLENVCNVAIKVCLIILVICGTITLISGVVLLAFGCISSLPWEVSE